MLSTINIVSKEQVVGLGRKCAVFEEPEQVVVLPVHIAADFQWSFKLEKNRLGQKYFARLKIVT